jgi:hypothetical protein
MGADMDVGDFHMLIIPKQKDATPSAKSRAMRVGAKSKTTNIRGRSLV